MKRAARNILRVLTGLSLMLCVAACVLWVRSGAVADRIEWVPRRPGAQVVGTIVKFASASGGVDFEVHTLRVDAPIDPAAVRGKWEENQTGPGLVWRKVPPWSSRLGFFDFFWLHDHGVRGDRHLSEDKFFVATPYLAVMVLSLILPAGWASSRVWAATRHRAGHCRHCGYDLRATPDRCPECGTVPSVKT